MRLIHSRRYNRVPGVRSQIELSQPRRQAWKALAIAADGHHLPGATKGWLSAPFDSKEEAEACLAAYLDGVPADHIKTSGVKEIGR
jgi:hypothetical protein